MEKSLKYTSVDDALIKLQSYCSYQERCHTEVRTKLISLKIYRDDLENIITQLIDEGFLDEERFARAYARGKFRIKQWGRIKIKIALKQKKVSDYCIRKAMTEIVEEDYLDTLEQLIVKKLRTEDFSNLDYKSKQKMTNWAMGRGFELPLILGILNAN